MRSSNPVLTRLTPETQQGYGQPTGYGYPSPAVAPAFDRMTMDDVVVRTVGLLAVTLISGAAAWTLVPPGLTLPVLIGAALIGVVLGLVISFAQITNPLIIMAYAVVEGAFLGLISKQFESFYEGIVLQAAAGTFGIFFLMAMLYKSRVIRATPRFVKFVTAAVVGIFAVILVNFVLSLFGINTGLRDGSAFSIIFSLVIIVIASLTFILDFAQIEEGVRAGAPKRFAWACSFGILVGLIWLYLEILRLLSYLRE